MIITIVVSICIIAISMFIIIILCLSKISMIIEGIFNDLSVVGMHLEASLIVSFYRSRSTVRKDSEALEMEGRGFKQRWFGITRLACEQVSNKSEKFCIESKFIIKYTSAQTVASPEDWVARGAG